MSVYILNGIVWSSVHISIYECRRRNHFFHNKINTNYTQWDMYGRTIRSMHLSHTIIFSCAKCRGAYGNIIKI